MLENFDRYGYIGVFVALIAAGFGFPIPEELPVITAGILVGHGDTNLRWYIMLPVVIAGVVIADGLLYAAGRLWGTRLLEIGWVKRRLLPPEKREEIEKNFAARGIMVLLGARLLPGIRTPIFLMAGVLRVPLGRFLLADGIYAIPLVNLLFWLSYVLTDQMLEVFRQIQKVQEEYRPVVIVAILSAVAGALLHKYLFGRKVVTGNPAEMPPLLVRPTEVIGHALEHAIDRVRGHGDHERSLARPGLARPSPPVVGGPPAAAPLLNLEASVLHAEAVGPEASVSHAPAIADSVLKIEACAPTFSASDGPPSAATPPGAGPAASIGKPSANGTPPLSPPPAAEAAPLPAETANAAAAPTDRTAG